MKSKIHKLSSQVINQIAAGEVIENPASVVKELVENAIDAGSKRIKIEIQGGGQRLIRVEDDGYGMTIEDACLSLERHATSKIHKAEDILDLSTMGFRGEALASIASISKLTMLTKQEKKTGVSILTQDGKIFETKPCARTNGTTVEVRSLFYNVPARKKFQKSILSTSAEIRRVVHLLSLASPEVEFILLNHTEEILVASYHPHLSLEASIQFRIQSLFSENFISELTWLNSQKEKFHVFGYIGHPESSRSTHSGQFIFVNKRAVSCPLITEAVEEGYGTCIKKGSHPIFILYFQIPSSLIDVNVHPQKKEIRLRDEKLLKEIISKAIFQGLGQDEKIYPEVKKEIRFENSQEESSKEVTQDFFPDEEKLFQQPKLESNLNLAPIFREITLLGSYLLLEEEDFSEKKLILVDINAAYSRLVFESFACFFEEKEKEEGQVLLFPKILDVSQSEIVVIREYLPKFSQMGVEIRILGEKTVAIDALPPFIKIEQFPDLFHILIQDLIKYGFSKQIFLEKEKQFARSICRLVGQGDKTSSIKGSIKDAMAIFTELLSSKNRYHSPLGKPTMMYLSKEDFDRLFSSKNGSLS